MLTMPWIQHATNEEVLKRTGIKKLLITYHKETEFLRTYEERLKGKFETHRAR